MLAQIFGRTKCDQRKRVDSLRYGVEAFSVRLLSPREVFSEGGDHLPDLAAGDNIFLARSGVLPASPAKAMEMIRAMQPEGAESLTAEQVYIHFGEAANGNFIPDRYAFIHSSTLKNIAADMAAGVSFMGNHATGSYFQPAQFALGRTFCARYEEWIDQKGQMFARTMFGFYMVRGLRPNGESGPSTDDLHAMIDAGTLFDLSVGLTACKYICNVCGQDLLAWDDEKGYLCPHSPGSTRHMSAAEQKKAKQMGVPDGAASYSIVDGRCAEISGVYDGAVPGAGLRESLSLSRRGRFNRKENGMELFGSIADALREHVTEPILAALGRVPREPEVAPVSQLEAQLAAERAERERLAAEVEALKTASTASAESARKARAEALVESLVRDHYVLPSDESRQAALDVILSLGEDRGRKTFEAIGKHGAFVRESGEMSDGEKMDYSAPGQIGDQFRALVAAKMQANPKLSHREAFSAVCVEHPDIAKKHFESRPVYAGVQEA